MNRYVSKALHGNEGDIIAIWWLTTDELLKGAKHWTKEESETGK